MQWEEEDGPHHAEPASQKRCREVHNITIYGCGVSTALSMIGCFEELCGAHPGEADQAENYQATIHFHRSGRAEQDLGQILLCWK